MKKQLIAIIAALGISFAAVAPANAQFWGGYGPVGWGWGGGYGYGGWGGYGYGGWGYGAAALQPLFRSRARRPPGSERGRLDESPARRRGKGADGRRPRLSRRRLRRDRALRDHAARGDSRVHSALPGSARAPRADHRRARPRDSGAL